MRQKEKRIEQAKMVEEVDCRRLAEKRKTDIKNRENKKLSRRGNGEKVIHGGTCIGLRILV